MLRRAIARGRVAQVALADATDTGLDPSQADLVMVANLLHLHPDPGAVLVEACRLAKPGGIVVCVWPAETASLGGAFSADLASGRPFMGSIAAAFLRLAIGLGGASVRARLWPGSFVAEAVAAWAEGQNASLLHSGTVHGQQEYSVFETAA
jgi:SAM-dependent methyltransferase